MSITDMYVMFIMLPAIAITLGWACYDLHGIVTGVKIMIPIMVLFCILMLREHGGSKSRSTGRGHATRTLTGGARKIMRETQTVYDEYAKANPTASPETIAALTQATMARAKNTGTDVLRL